MKKHAFPAGKRIPLGSLLAALALAVAGPLTAPGAERMVLGEEFTTLG